MEKQDIDRDAAEWLVRLDDLDRPADLRSQQEWLAWLRRSPEHLRAYFGMAHVSQWVDEVPPAGRARLRAMLAEHRAQSQRETYRKRWQFGAKLAAAASLACIAAGSLWFALSSPRYATGVGEQMSYTLPDGSLMLLNTRSKARVSMNERERVVELEGEGLFTVARDTTRPFRVRTSSAVAQAIGTQFNMYVRNDGTTKVSVVEGAVKISPVSGFAAGRSLLLSAGQEGEVRENRLSQASVPQVATAVAWKSRTLVFEDSPIAEVTAQFNRYNEIQFVIAPELSEERRLSGTFDPRRPEYFRIFLERDSSLAVREKDGVVYVSASGQAH